MSDAQTIMPIADTRREVAAQPAVIARVLGELHQPIRELAATFVQRDIRRMFLLGSGDSWFAGMAARLALEHYAGVSAEGGATTIAPAKAFLSCTEPTCWVAGSLIPACR